MSTTYLPNISASAFFIINALKQKSVHTLFTCNSEEELEIFEAAYKTFAPKNFDYKFLSVYEDKFSLYSALEVISNSETPLFIATTYSALKQEVAGKKDFSAQVLKLKKGQTINRTALIDTLHKLDYKRVDFAEAPADYALRGSVLDIFPINAQKPCRLYFRINTIEKISTFDLDTQNTVEETNELLVLPFEFEVTPSTLQRWLKDFKPYFYEPPQNTKSENEAEILTALPDKNGQDSFLRSPLDFKANFTLFDNEILTLNKKNIKSTFFCLNKGEMERLTEVFQDYDNLKTLPLAVAPLQEGFYSTKENFAFFTSTQLLKHSYKQTNFAEKFDKTYSKHVRFKELEVGDYVVHQEHGIGRYGGLITLEQDNLPLDCLLIEFKGSQKLYVPLHDFRKVQKYIGLKGRAPKISSLNTTTWKEVKKRVKEDAQKVAKEILQAAALRSAHKADILLGNEHLEREFADSFPYQETDDQTQAINEILQDLNKDIPMDRVLIGDVGFGKTEVAIRAALRAVLSNKQVLVLVPTTVLASQHFKTFKERLQAYPINIEMLSRFQTKTEQKKVVENIKQGKVDIVVGTHRLLSKDVVFKNLGLCIVDEEHRFGVKQKEKIKAKSVGVHTLMLSATPIPRTLNQSLSALRQMSIIQTAPQGRMPIKTFLCAYQDDIVTNAVREELARGGQVFYLFNTVATMEEKREYLQKLMPEIKIICAHGQMPEQELEKTLWDFYNKKYDVLLCSTIVESGLDVTNANTLIVENPQNFGLAQLYQLRGRIGRGNKKAYCYLLAPSWILNKREEDFNPEDFYFPKKKSKPSYAEAQKRLSALLEFSELGSGFKLALRDLEIRGGGDLLGIRQHGYVNAVGLSLYCDLVANEVKKLRGEPIIRKMYATVNLGLPAFIAPDYLPSDEERLKFYKDFLEADQEAKQKLKQKIENLCGPAPKELNNLIEIMQISADAGEIKIRAIEAGPKFYDFYFARNAQIQEDALTKIMETFKGKMEFLPSQNGDGFRIFDSQNNKLTEVKQILNSLKNILLTVL
ncbi:MAG: DEAD/DEAH box helicase [Elusimicrobiaceae bacterium]|nr:DEAD/DEAH box helicase [Elusimicrobiaceae bacterium]